MHRPLSTTYSLNVSLSLTCLRNSIGNSLHPSQNLVINRNQISNYCPISLLCNLSKVLKNSFWQDLWLHFRKLYFHPPIWFYKNRSTLKQLLLYIEFLYSSLDHHQQVESIYLNIFKAFDTIPHNKLLVKLWSSGLTGSLWHFFNAYLTDMSASCTGWSLLWLASHYIWRSSR